MAPVPIFTPPPSLDVLGAPGPPPPSSPVPEPLPVAAHAALDEPEASQDAADDDEVFDLRVLLKALEDSLNEM